MADNENERPAKMIKVVNKHSAHFEGIAPGAEGEVDQNNPAVVHALDGGVLELKHGEWKTTKPPVQSGDPFDPPRGKSQRPPPPAAAEQEPAKPHYSEHPKK